MKTYKRYKRNTWITAGTILFIVGGAMVASAFMLQAGTLGIVVCGVFWIFLLKVV